MKSLLDSKIVRTFATAKDALVAQLVEHLTLNQGVQGSTPCRRTKEEVNESLSLLFFLIYSYSD